MPTLSIEAVRELSERALLAHGADPVVAETMASSVAEAEATGNRICGLAYLESYCVQLRSGRVRGAGDEAVVTTPKPGLVHVDGRHGFAHVAYDAGAAVAVAAAQTNGVALLVLAHTHTCTALAWFTERLARTGVIALGMTNATARVAAPGGTRGLLGTNPIAFSVPDGDGGIAWGFDFSTSAIALGKILAAAKSGESIPLGWAVDRQGAPTTDAAAALEGSLLSAGGHKGYGFGLMVEVLTAGLAGTNRSVHVPPLKAPDGPPHDLAQTFVLIDPGAHLADTVAGLRAELADQPGARLPGDGRTPQSEVDVTDPLWSTIRELDPATSA